MKIKLLFILILISSALSAQSYYDSVWTDYFRLNSGGWTAGDATISVHLPDNRALWLFGDSYTAPVNITNNTLPCLFNVRNCMMVQDSVDKSHFKTILDTTQTGVNQTTFKLAVNDTAIFWPGAGYVRGDTVFIFLERYSATILGLYHGCYIAKLEYPGLHQIGIYEVHNNANSIFGRAVAVDEQAGKLYIYGNKLNWIVWEPVVARCDLSNPLGPWEYYTGSDWSPYPNRVQKISQEPVSPGFSVFTYGDKYYLMTQENGYMECGLGRELYSMESDYPWGPYVNKKLLYTEESTFNGNYMMTYNAQAHPWALENGEMLIGYNVNDRVDTTQPYICPSQCVSIFSDRLDADTYRPKFVRVPIDLIAGINSTIRHNFKMKAYPNPIRKGDDIFVSYDLLTREPVKLTISDVSGRIIKNQKHEGIPGRNKVIVNIPSGEGIYFLKLETSVGNDIIKFIIFD